MDPLTKKFGKVADEWCETGVILWKTTANAWILHSTKRGLLLKKNIPPRLRVRFFMHYEFLIIRYKNFSNIFLMVNIHNISSQGQESNDPREPNQFKKICMKSISHEPHGLSIAWRLTVCSSLLERFLKNCKLPGHPNGWRAALRLGWANIDCWKGSLSLIIGSLTPRRGRGWRSRRQGRRLRLRRRCGAGQRFFKFVKGEMTVAVCWRIFSWIS